MKGIIYIEDLICINLYYIHVANTSIQIYDIFAIFRFAWITSRMSDGCEVLRFWMCTIADVCDLSISDDDFFERKCRQIEVFLDSDRKQETTSASHTACTKTDPKGCWFCVDSICIVSNVSEGTVSRGEISDPNFSVEFDADREYTQISKISIWR